jgi:hypothetical protein
MTRDILLVGSLGVIVYGAAGGPGPVLAQSHQPERSGQSIARLETVAGILEGKLTRVDGRQETVEVSIGFLGLLGRTLQVNRNTLIQVDGREGRFADLHEGLRVKAFYEERGARLVATRLEISTDA